MSESAHAAPPIIRTGVFHDEVHATEESLNDPAQRKAIEQNVTSRVLGRQVAKAISDGREYSICVFTYTVLRSEDKATGVRVYAVSADAVVALAVGYGAEVGELCVINEIIKGNDFEFSINGEEQNRSFKRVSIDIPGRTKPLLYWRRTP